MKNTQICPKCQSKKIGRKRGTPVLNSWSRIAVNLTTRDIWVTKYICTECGYIEEWIDSTNDIQRLKAKLD